MGELIASLRRLVGIDPEQKKQQARFDKAKEQLDGNAGELDDLLKEFEAINQRATKKAKKRTLPPSPSIEPKEATG